MFQSDNFNDYGDGYYGGTHFNMNGNNAMQSVECRQDSGSMYQISQILMDGIYSHNEIKSVKFDPFEELVWCISSSGHLSAYYECELSRLVSVEVPEMNGHQGKSRRDQYTGASAGTGANPYELRGLLVGADVILVLGSTELLVYKRTGTQVARIKLNDGPSGDGSGTELRCLCQSGSGGGSGGSMTVIVGSDSRLTEVDVERRKAVRNIDLPGGNGVGGAALLSHHSRGELCGTQDGQIISIDWKDRRSVQHSFKPHSHGLSDFSANSEGYAVVSCGTYLCNQQVYADQFLKVYDLRYRKAQCPIRAEMQPAFVRFVPAFNDSILLGAAEGQFQIANFGQNHLPHPTDEALLLNEYDSIRAIDISSSSKMIAFGTRWGLLSLVANTVSVSSGNSAGERGGDVMKINHCSRETPFPPIPHYMNLQPVAYDDQHFIPSSSEFAPEPIDKNRFSKLSSDWPAELCSGRFKKLKPVDMSLFSQYQSKFKTELIGRKPTNWGPVWFPY